MISQKMELDILIEILLLYYDNLIMESRINNLRNHNRYLEQRINELKVLISDKLK
nr:hypothetical protein TDPV-111 [Oriental turtle dovepox virus]